MQQTYSGVKVVDVHVTAESVEVREGVGDTTRLDRSITWSLRTPTISAASGRRPAGDHVALPVLRRARLLGPRAARVPPGTEVHAHSSAASVRATGLTGVVDLSSSAGSVSATGLRSTDVSRLVVGRVDEARLRGAAEAGGRVLECRLGRGGGAARVGRLPGRRGQQRRLQHRRRAHRPRLGPHDPGPLQRRLGPGPLPAPLTPGPSTLACSVQADRSPAHDPFATSGASDPLMEAACRGPERRNDLGTAGQVTSGEPVAALGGWAGARGRSASRRPPQRSITAAEPTLSSSQVTSTRSTPCSRATARLCRSISVA